VPREARAVDYAGILRASLKASGLASGQRVVVDREELKRVNELASTIAIHNLPFEDGQLAAAIANTTTRWLSHSSQEEGQ
jgi:hypothetical protein